MSRILKTLFSNKNKVSSISAVLYPEQILIQTNHRIKNSYWIGSDKITFLKHSVTQEELGRIAFEHLELSKDGIKMPSDEQYKNIQQIICKQTGLKTIKAQMKNAENLWLEKKSTGMRMIPTENGGSFGKRRGYHHLNDLALKLDLDAAPEEVGMYLRKVWELCRFRK